jgi:hypothetical protein
MAKPRDAGCEGMRWFALLAFMALFAGCLEEPAPEAGAQLDPEDEDPGRVARQGRDPDRGDDEDEEEERSGDRTLRSYRDEFGATLTSANALVNFNVGGYDCVAVEGAPYHILNGTATFTWTSQSPLTDSLEAELRSYYSDEVEILRSGPSPLVVEFEDLEIEEDDDLQDFLTFGIHVAPPAGAAYEQEVTMLLAFEYESDIDVDVSPGYC